MDASPPASSARADRPASSVLRFGPFRLDVAEARLSRDDRPVALRPKAFELLVALAARPNELVTKDELLDRVWGRRFITEGVIKSIVGELRVALADDPRQPRWIETVPRRGYRFIGILDGGGGPAGPPPAAAAEHSATTSVEGNVPLAMPDPIGREEALVRVAALHDTHRLLTVTGPSGVGKTRLALALADRRRAAWRDGVWFVELASLAGDTTDVRSLCATIVQLLRLEPGAATDAATLARALRPLRLLLVLDNAEHVLGPVATLVAALLDGTTSLRIVVTSQEPLRVPGEQVDRLAPLALPVVADDADGSRLMGSSAVQLFVQRVSMRIPNFTLMPQQQQAIATICRALDGMPLALELAAARVPVLGVHGIADLLLGDDGGARLQLLTGGARTAVPRQRTLRNAIAWSYGLLDDRQRTIFDRLGVFRGSFTLRSAQTVCGDDALDAWFVIDALDALVDKSLLESCDGPDGPRFRLLESLRAHALERLDAAGTTAATRDRHLLAVRAYWAEADARSLDEPTLPWIAQHLAELDNLRAGLRWAEAREDRDALVALVGHSATLWCRIGLGDEGRHWCEVARPTIAEADPDGARPLDLAVSTLALYATAYPAKEAVLAAGRAADAYEAAGDPSRAYYALYLRFQLEQRAQARSDRPTLLDRMARLERPHWNALRRRFLRQIRGYELRLSGDAAGYLALCRSEVALCREAGALAEAWQMAHGQMLAEHDLGLVDDAIATGRGTIAEIRAAGRLRQHATFFALWMTMVAERSDVVATRRALAEALPLLHGTGGPWMAHVALGWLAVHEGRDDDAARIVGCHFAALASGRALASGVYIARASQALCDGLAKRLGHAGFDAARDGGRLLDDEAAEQLALGPAG